MADTPAVFQTNTAPDIVVDESTFEPMRKNEGWNGLPLVEEKIIGRSQEALTTSFQGS